MRDLIPVLLVALIPMAAIITAIVAVLLYDLHLYRTGRPTISDQVRVLYARFGVIVPIVYVALWTLIVAVPMVALIVHWFLYMY